MKYSNYIGSVAAVLLIISCFIPWVYIESIKTVITGFQTEHTNFGRPGAMHVFFSIVSIIFFFTPKVWAKRINVFVVTFNFAWSVRNFLLITQCEIGECPEKRMGIYIIVLLSFIMLIMGLLPKMKLKES